jgi:Flp pilus assembly protein TadG
LNLPVWIILVLMIVQFGQLSSSVQHVTRASRVGAEVAAQTAPLPAAGEVPSQIVDAIQCQLAKSGLACSQVILEHNLADAPVTLVSGTGGGTPPANPLPDACCVRVTVFVPVAAIMPNLLGKMGVDLWSQAVVQSTTYRYQMQPGTKP